MTFFLLNSRCFVSAFPIGGHRLRLILTTAVIMYAVTLEIRVSCAQSEAPNANIELFRRAKAGDAEAQELVARKYLSGDGTKADPVKAKLWFRKAAEQGRATASVELGKMLAIGIGGELDPVAANTWFLKAAEAVDAQGKFWMGHSSEKDARGLVSEMIQPADRSWWANPIRDDLHGLTP